MLRISRKSNLRQRVALLAVALLGACTALGQPGPTPRNFPATDSGVDTLAARKQAQMETVNQFKVFYQFHSTDKLKDSGITFVKHTVDDTARQYKGVHYDHGTGIAVADVDGDELYDIYFVNQIGGNELWKNLGGGRSSVIFDLDNDGDLDIVTNDFNSEPQVLISDLAQVKQIHWVEVVLTGTSSNRDGLGATVRVHAGGQAYTKYNDGKSGYLSQSDATKIDRIEVQWPSGRKQALTDGLTVNQTLRITEPK